MNAKYRFIYQEKPLTPEELKEKGYVFFTNTEVGRVREFEGKFKIINNTEIKTTMAYDRDSIRINDYRAIYYKSELSYDEMLTIYSILNKFEGKSPRKELERIAKLLTWDYL